MERSRRKACCRGCKLNEDLKGATVESYEVYRQIKEYLNTNLKELQKLSTSQLINKRYEKYRKIGQVF